MGNCAASERVGQVRAGARRRAPAISSSSRLADVGIRAPDAVVFLGAAVSRVFSAPEAVGRVLRNVGQGVIITANWSTQIQAVTTSPSRVRVGLASASRSGALR